MTRNEYYHRRDRLIVVTCVFISFGLVTALGPGPLFLHLIGLLILLFWGGLGGLIFVTMKSYPVIAPFDITDDHEFYALEHFGYFVEELQEQYIERRKLLTNCPRASKRRPILREMVNISETRLREVQENTCSSQN